ncbi:head maturation protease, ClpP-related [Amycolatopsis sp. WQ 127309]|uniref:head maturation protease, ClpP-related n=1 Tax=Amycolatopsis sp. WQ 127309 TaxID=2932773 RepID=UPI001FF5F3B2|nr:head maturation protease, ClpP-related [Amycolatopsis sp. WQ 127309]UOZ10536.1 Clp protease ClpP [Amycolatopsis sp. WQ 127309]
MAVPPYLRREHQKLTPRNFATATAGKKPGWYEIRNLANNTAEVFVYDEIGGWGVMAADFVRDLQAIDADSVTVRISSPGGDVFDALAMHASLHNLDATVNVVVDGLCASAATVVAMAGDTVATAPGSMWMIHDAMAVVAGNAADVRQMADLLDKTSTNIADIYAGRAGGSSDDWRTTMQAETWYTADEAVTAKLADSLTESKAPTARTPVVINKHEPPAFVFDADQFRQLVKEAVS